MDLEAKGEPEPHSFLAGRRNSSADLNQARTDFLTTASGRDFVATADALPQTRTDVLRYFQFLVDRLCCDHEDILRVKTGRMWSECLKCDRETNGITVKLAGSR